MDAAGGPAMTISESVRNLVQHSTLPVAIKPMILIGISAIPPEKLAEIMSVLKRVVVILARDPEGMDLLQGIGIGSEELQVISRQ